MAVGAADNALVDLALDGLPAAAAAQQCRHVGTLRSHMVEVEHDDIGFPAVDTRMRAQVGHETLAILEAPGRGVSQEPRLLRDDVLSVVARVVFSKAGAAPGVKPRLTATDGRKCRERLLGLAARADLHADISSGILVGGGMGPPY